MLKKLILLLLLVSLLMTGCGSNGNQTEESYEDEESEISSQREDDADEKDNDEDKINGHNSDEVIKEIGPGKNDPQAEVGPSNATPSQQTSLMKKDLEEAISRSTCSVDYNQEEMTGLDLLNFTISLETIPTDALLVDMVKSMMTVLKQYALKDELELTVQIHDENDAYCYLDYIDIQETLIAFDKDPDSIVALASYASFSNKNTDFNAILNTNVPYMSIEQAIDTVRSRFTQFVKRYGSDQPITIDKVEMTTNFYQKEDGLFYMVELNAEELYFYYNFDAATGDMIDFFEGNKLPVSVPSPELRKAAMEMYVGNGYQLDANDIVSLYQVGNNLVSIQTIDDYYHYYHFKQQNGKYSFEEYVMPMSE